MTTTAELGDKLAETKKPQTFPAMLNAFLPEIRKALPRQMSAERMARIALTAFRRNPQLQQCDPRSVFAAVIQSAQLGLEPDTLGRSFLVPYKNRQSGIYECQFIPGWKGLVDLVNRSKQGSVWSGAVFKGDDFDYGLGDRPFVKHRPMDNDAVEDLSHVYAVGRVNGAEWPMIEVWTINKVQKHLSKYNKVGTRHYAFENMEMYARKVVLLQVIKYMPASPELVAAVSLNEAAEMGNQDLNIKDVLDGTWVQPIPEKNDEVKEDGNLA